MDLEALKKSIQENKHMAPALPELVAKEDDDEDDQPTGPSLDELREALWAKNQER